MNPPEGFTPVHLDALRELINIGFGKAAVALSDLASCRIRLRVPEVRILPVNEILMTMDTQARNAKPCFAVAQTFSGQVSGSSLLCIPGSHIPFLAQGYSPPQTGVVQGVWERAFLEETATETGNIVMESCTGTLADLLDCRITFQPPHLVDQDPESTRMPPGSNKAGTVGILCRTAYGFGQDDEPGFLCMAISGASLAWLQDALNKYLANIP